MELYTELLKTRQSNVFESTCSTDVKAVIRCAACCSENEHEANWCTECGKVLLDGYLIIPDSVSLHQTELNTGRIDCNTKSKSAPALDDSRLLEIQQSKDIKSVSKLSLEDEGTPKYTLDFFHSKKSTSPLASGTSEFEAPREKHPNASKENLHNDSRLWSSKCKSKFKNPLDHQLMRTATASEIYLPTVKETTSSRHWETSSHYIWKKPCTLRPKRTNRKGNGIGNLPEAIPLLNLNSIPHVDESVDNLSLSRRKNKVGLHMYLYSYVQAACLYSCLFFIFTVIHVQPL